MKTDLTDNQNKILSVLQHGYSGEICYNYRHLEAETGLNRKTLQQEMRYCEG